MKSILYLLIGITFLSFGQKKNNSNLNPNPNAFKVLKKVFENVKNSGTIKIDGGHKTGLYSGSSELMFFLGDNELGELSVNSSIYNSRNGQIERQTQEFSTLNSFKYLNNGGAYGTKVLTADWDGFAAKLYLYLTNDKQKDEVYIKIEGKTNWSHFARIEVSEVQFIQLRNLLSIYKPSLQILAKEKELIAKRDEMEANLKEFEKNSWKTDVVEVKSKTGRIWMDRNLGASRAALSNYDENSFGDFYQWGRGTDGHQKLTSNVSYVKSDKDKPGHSYFIDGGSFLMEWRDPRNDNLWKGLKGINNPCPNGFRLPTENEWIEEMATWSSLNAWGAINSSLKLPSSGERSYQGNIDFYNNEKGKYWSSSTKNGVPLALFFNNVSSKTISQKHAWGFCVRCIKD